jgi:hypothetical protein
MNCVSNSHIFVRAITSNTTVSTTATATAATAATAAKISTSDELQCRHRMKVGQQLQLIHTHNHRRFSYWLAPIRTRIRTQVSKVRLESLCEDSLGNVYVNSAKWIVRYDDIRIPIQRACNADTLLLATCTHSFEYITSSQYGQ